MSETPDTTAEARQWAMFLHLSQLANFLIPFGGIVAPIVIWQLKKDVLSGIDEHGKVVVNWLISALIYGVGAFILSFILIGIPLLIALALVGLVFPIVGGIKASNGELWVYPLSISFLK